MLQFIGDEIEAAFGAPVVHPKHPEMAVRAALEMRRRLARWNAERARAGKVALRHGIGIHTGSVLAGIIGSAERHSYALGRRSGQPGVADPEPQQGFDSDILVSGDTRRRLDSQFELVPLPAARQGQVRRGRGLPARLKLVGARRGWRGAAAGAAGVETTTRHAFAGPRRWAPSRCATSVVASRERVPSTPTAPAAAPRHPPPGVSALSELSSVRAEFSAVRPARREDGASACAPGPPSAGGGRRRS